MVAQGIAIKPCGAGWEASSHSQVKGSDLDDRRAFGGKGVRMDYTTVFAVWTVAITGPCVISWLVGDMTGATRTRQLYADGVSAHEPITAHDQNGPAFVVEQWRVQGAIHPLSEAVVSPEKLETPRVPRAEEQAADAERRRLRRASLASRVERMSTEWAPPALDPRPEVPQSVTVVPDPSHVLHHYARSVDSLERGHRQVALHD